ncbi:MAG: hypothetical protein KDC76_14435, partial [Bacteroidetes bacterium]|nr:hypothetical protein [Bacteroidota bacterium]
MVESLDGNGLPVTIHAALKDKSNTLIDSVVTSYKGMASIDFTPHLENRYHLEFTHADATAGRVDLVEPASRGNIIWFKHLNSGLEVHVGPHAANHTLVISGSGSIVQTHRINRDVLDLFIPKNELKEGVLSVALYSGNDLREHRLTFVRPVEPEVDLMMRGDRMDLQSSVNGKIQWSFKEYGSLNYTLRVINTQYLNQIRDHGHSMRSWLWLGDEFNTDMEDGDDYFKTDEDAYAYTQLYVDTYRNRWRRDPANGKMIAREDVIYPRGVVNFNGYLKSIRDYSQPIDRARLRIKGTNVETFSDSMGHFEFINVPSQWMSEEYITLIISKGLERFEYVVPNSYYYFSNSFSPTSGVSRSNGDLGLLSPIIKGIEQASPSYKSLLRTSLVTQPTSPYYNKNAVRDYSINESNMMSLDLACVSRIIYLYQQPFAYQNDYPPSNSYYDPYAVLLTPSRIRLSPIDMNDRDMNSAIKYWRPNGMAERGNEPFTFSSGYTEGGYTIICEGVTGTGNPFKVEKSFHVQDAVTIDAKSPLTASFGDTISYRILVSNHADSSLTIDLTYGIDEKIESTLRLNPDETKELRYIWVAPDSTIYLNLIVDGRFSGRTKRFTRPVQVIERGHSRKEFLTVTNTTTKTFPIESMLMDRFIIRLETIENFSKMLNQTAASMIRQPHGCFEQVSSSNYPNILAARILSESSNASQILYEQAMRALQDGYKRLAAYETSEGGFEWYGRNPPHESLTAYGLLQFHLMQQVGIQVDQKLLERTQKWLLSRRDGKGGFKYHPGRYGFSSASY